MLYYKHPTAEVSKKAKIGKNTKIWHLAQIRKEAEIGENCIIGKNVYIDKGVKIGNNCKIQNNCSIYQGTTIKDGVFIGPHVVFTNDRLPRAINPDGTLKSDADWIVGKILVKKGASIGANVTVLPDIIIGKYAMVGAGSLVSRNIPDHTLVFGNPAKIHGEVDKSGRKIQRVY